MLEIDGLHLSYGDAVALSDVSLTVGAGEIVAIVGANGAGKTSLIQTVAGIHRPDRGRIVFDGTDITGWPSHRVCNLGVGQVAEGRQIFPSMSVQENLEMGAMISRARAQAAVAYARVLGIFPRLAERRKQMAGTLSGGEQQMLAIGRCLMGAPRLVMFDEPSLGLAPMATLTAFEALKQLHQRGVTILLVEQNVNSTLHLVDRAYVLEQGRIVLEGTGEQLLSDGHVQEAYLGI